MIKDQKPLTYGEVLELVKNGENAEKITSFIKEFYKLKPDESKKLKEELTSLDIIKLKENHIVNIVNFLPTDASDLIKVTSDASLDQEEIDKILNATKKY